MASQTGKWREDQVLVICPGSQTTMAQLGCAELTPPANRLPTRMFKDDDADEWRPYYTYKRRKASHAAAPGANGDAQQAAEGAQKNGDDEDEYEWVEDPDSAEGAVYPIQGGRIVNMDAFLAFLEHVHGMLTTTYHNTPIMLMASPQWTRPDCEAIARYVFEKTRTPALCLIHSGVATQYGLKWPNMTVVDVGFEKVDVTCIYDSRVVGHREVGYPCGRVEGEGDGREISGGEVFTRRLLKLLGEKGFTYEMAEQLKKSSICEVLPYVPDSPQLMELPEESPIAGQGAAAAPAAPAAAQAPAPVAAPAAAASGTTADGHKIGESGATADGDDEANGEEKPVDSEGVLDVASIVTSGQTKEFLAKKEKEKAERAKARKQAKSQEGADAANKPARLPNSKRVRNVFHYEEIVQEEVPVAKPNGAPKDQEMKDAPPAATATTEPADAVAAPESNGDAAPKPEASAEQQEAPKEEKEKAEGDAVKADSSVPPPESNPAPATAPATELQAKRIRRDIDVGLERFTFADRAQIDRIVTTIYRAVQGVDDMYMRPYCWENLVFVGNGCRIRGLKENILQTLNARHIISPSSATMFTSELPSNLATPSGTGSQTPVGSFGGPPHQLPTSSSVNPLLQAATTASLSLPPGGGTPGGAPGSTAGGEGGLHSHHFHSQTPTAIKLAPLPTYLSEWTKNGFEEAMFLGAQVAARLAFCVHNMDAHGLEAQRMMSLSRVDYNDMGPKAIRTHSMLG
ncbi:SWI/SNF and RSC complexes subunit arp9 [Pleurostoma richardsiae]|uniref:SWI/SNF and RSC complexes subunit arp9 n=1 Tax=Pleurostoma richardsiae TaxID=41990 RepID=A0AA38RQL1_9PEZI|nr:SWI/SNF and RSC complexes subunit arp9 [Pleurostoma richardsiae]